MEGNSFMFINMIINGIAAVISLVLIFMAGAEKKKTEENRMFFLMGIFNLIAAAMEAADLFNLLSLLQIPLFLYIFDIISRLSAVGIEVLWILFVEYTLHQSRDVIRRRYTVRLIPLFIAAAMMAVNAILGTAPLIFIPVIEKIYFVFLYIALPIRLFYMIVPFSLVLIEKKRKRIPNDIMITPTAVCIIIGFFIEYVVASFHVMAITYSLALVFLYYSMFRRFQKIDKETGFFNERYIRTILDYVEKNHVKGGTVIRFCSDNTAGLAKILHLYSPESSKTIVMDNGDILVVAETQPEHIVKKYLALVAAQTGKAGIKAEPVVFNRTEEPAEEFLKQIKR